MYYSNKYATIANEMYLCTNPHRTSRIIISVFQKIDFFENRTSFERKVILQFRNLKVIFAQRFTVISLENEAPN